MRRRCLPRSIRIFVYGDQRLITATRYSPIVRFLVSCCTWNTSNGNKYLGSPLLRRINGDMVFAQRSEFGKEYIFVAAFFTQGLLFLFDSSNTYMLTRFLPGSGNTQTPARSLCTGA